MQPQVDKKHYHFKQYGYVGRFASYWYQLKTVLSFEPKSVLEIGVGDRVFGNFLKQNSGVVYQSCDIDPALEPDIVGSIDALPIPDKAYDVVCAFEVLEHLPFDKFELALKELRRVALKKVVISLPHFGPPCILHIKIPFIKEIKLAWKFPWPQKHVFNGQHYWEIGKRGFSPQVIRNVLDTLFIIEDEFVPFENQYHHFFVLQPKITN